MEFSIKACKDVEQASSLLTDSTAAHRANPPLFWCSNIHFPSTNNYYHRNSFKGGPQIRIDSKGICRWNGVSNHTVIYLCFGENGLFVESTERPAASPSCPTETPAVMAIGWWGLLSFAGTIDLLLDKMRHFIRFKSLRFPKKNTNDKSKSDSLWLENKNIINQ